MPQGVWEVKNVKVKNIEEKIANLDLLTAALMKLSFVDTLDAEAVLEEMQILEGFMEQAQANLSKKLGSEVGVSTISLLFKDAPQESSVPSQNPDTKGNTTSTGSRSSSKGYLNSWKKLRNKSSSTNLAAQSVSKDAHREGFTMSTVPLSTSINPRKSRPQRREESAASKKIASLKIDGPLANYASAIARLCDAAQILGKYLHLAFVASSLRPVTNVV